MIPLDPADFHRVAPSLEALPMNTLFARAVVEGHVIGSVWVDDVRAPGACYIAHPYGMSLLFGSTANESFRRSLSLHVAGDGTDRRSDEWLQVFPEDWTVVLDAMPVERDTRVNFRFDRDRYARMRASLVLPQDCEIIDDVRWIFANMRGSVVPSAFWDRAADLRSRGAAFALLHRGELASTAFVSFAIADVLELGIETVDRFRGRGFAVHACSALIDECLSRDREPVWACRLTNTGSYRLAITLGFDHLRSLPYYRLPPRSPSPHSTSPAQTR